MRHSVHLVADAAAASAVDDATVDSVIEFVASTNDCVDAILEDWVGAALKHRSADLWRRCASRRRRRRSSLPVD